MPRCPVPLALTWNHAGAAYRVTPWPEVQFERRYGAEWIAITSSSDALVGVRLSPVAWRSFLEFVPADVRELLALFRSNRLLALRVASRCPELVGVLTQFPALVTFIACHSVLRGSDTERWRELNAQFEHGGVFGVLEWLGLAATKTTLTIFVALLGADLPPGLTETVRQALWEPTGLLAAAAKTPLSGREGADRCALAA